MRCGRLAGNTLRGRCQSDASSVVMPQLRHQQRIAIRFVPGPAPAGSPQRPTASSNSCLLIFDRPFTPLCLASLYSCA